MAAVLFDSKDQPFYAIHDYLFDGLEDDATIGFEPAAFAPPDDVTIDTISSYVVFTYQDIF